MYLSENFNTHRGNKMKIEDHYFEIYNQEDAEGKRIMTNQVKGLLSQVPPEKLAMAIVGFASGDKDIWDADELNKKS